MDRKEFNEWLATCPTHKYEILVTFDGYVTVTFKLQEDENATNKH